MQDERAKDGRARRHAFQPLLFAVPRRETPPSAALVARAGHQANDAPRRAQDSHVRLRVADAARPRALAGNVEWLEVQELLDELGEDQLTLSMTLASLERATGDRPRDPATLAALESFDARLEDVATLCDVLAVLQLAAAPRTVHRALLPDAPLAEYLRGVYAWTFAVVRALEQLVPELRVMQPDWASYRWRIEEAKNFHFDELEHAIVDDLATLFGEGGDRDAVTDLTAAFEVLVACARELEVRLDERFG